MANKTIGYCTCPFCGNEKAEVRKYQTGTEKLYFWCQWDGMITPNAPGGQTWMLENSVMFGPTGKPESKPVNELIKVGIEQIASPEPVNESEPVEKKKGDFFDNLMSGWD